MNSHRRCVNYTLAHLCGNVYISVWAVAQYESAPENKAKKLTPGHQSCGRKNFGLINAREATRKVVSATADVAEGHCSHFPPPAA